MIRQPLRQNPSRQQTSSPLPIPAPVGGLNARDEWANMDPRDATVLTNWFPQASYVEIRRGYDRHRTDMADPVLSILTYNKPNGVDDVFAAAGGTIYEVTSAGTAATVESTGYTSDKFQAVNFTTSGGNYLVAVNGADNPIIYDGSAFTAMSISATGLTVDNLINVQSHQERLWFIERDTLNVWYLAVGTIAGTLIKLPLGSVFKLGGRLLAMGTMSHDSGDGINDYAVFITDQGEMAIYQGTNPGDPNDWKLSGRFRIGDPIGYRCIVNLGADLFIITTDGLISVTRTLDYDRAQQDAAAVTGKIQTLFNEAARRYKNNFGWQALVYPKGRWLVVNVPVLQERRQNQFVMNTITGAWCQFTGWNANCYGLGNGNLYFGGNDGVVYIADSTRQDNGTQIVADMQTAFNYFGMPSNIKQFQLVRPNLTTSGIPGVDLSVNVDFSNIPPSGNITVTPSTAGLWSDGDWGSALWGGAGLQIREWIGVSGVGYNAAVRLRVSVNGVSCNANAFDVVFQPGQIL